MAQSEWTAFLAPFFTIIVVAGVGVVARVILKRLPEGRLKRVLSWPPK
jgi:hypothetical protein